MFSYLYVGIFAIACLAASSCTTLQHHPSPLADTSLVLPYTFDLENRKHLKAPYVAKYERDRKLLLYVASEHISIQKSPNLFEHPTLRAIEHLFAEYKPEVVIVEGIDTGAELSPQSIVKKADECVAFNYRNCGESFFAINLARKSGTAYITGEPQNRQIKDEIVKAGHSAEDLLGFYLVRQIPQYRRQGDFDRKTFAVQAEKQLRRFQYQIGTDLKFGFKEFDAWYSAHMIKPRSYLDITNNDPAPHGGPDATYVQNISNKVGVIRDRAVVKTIERMFARYSRVLIVYGGSHLITQEPAIESMLGKPTYFRVEDKLAKNPSSRASAEPKAPTEVQ